ncbi:MAG: type 1 glutamine amidotransferase [Synechococcus sp. SB0668_bin_15]|nr:type 1 glutamine amidotransferase [Synechococcus sp. SB0668_bin_15]MYC50586.1 type 1 glutamine amidotransferase [Synechococcus sp. SB0662_bin_14]
MPRTPQLCIVQTIAREGPGLIGAMAMERGWQLQLTQLWTHQPLPTPQQGQAFLLLGGPASANDCHGRIPELIRLSQHLLEQRIPVMGICLGLQVLAKAKGCVVRAARQRELGWLDPHGQPWTLHQTPAGRHHPLLHGVPDPLPVFQLHGEEVVPDRSVETMASSPLCHNQIAALGPAAYGVQGHMELDPSMAERWFAEDDDLRPIAHQARFNQVGLEALMPVGRTLYGNWLTLAAQQLAADGAISGEDVNWAP